MDKFVLLVLLSTGAVVSSNPCNEENYQRCVNQLHSFVYKDNLIFGYSQEELQRECIIARKALDCLELHSRFCLTIESRDEFLQEIAGPEEIIVGLCSKEAELNRRYFEIIPCLQNASDGLRYCREKYNHNERDIYAAPYENKQQLRCCSFDGYRRCVAMLMELQMECMESSDVTEQITLKVKGSKFLESCSEHFEYCTGSGSHRIKSAMTIAYLIFIVLLWRLVFQ